MTNILYPPPRPQSVGEILDLAFRIFGTTLIKCLPFSILGVVLGHLTTMYDLATGHPALPSAALKMQQSHDALWWLLFLVAAVGSIAVSNAVLLRQYALATGHAAAASSELATGLRKVPGVVLIGILMALAIAATFLPVGIVLGIVLATGGGARMALGTAGFLLGAYLMLLVCASWAIARWICSGPAYLLTGRAPIDSMRHSWQLTRGSFWRLSAIYTVGIVLTVVLYLLSTVIGGIVVALVAHGDVAVITAATVVVVSLLGAFISPFYSALVLAVFGDASVRRQGVDLEQRISAPAQS